MNKLLQNYEEEGYCKFSSNEKDYMQLIDDCYNYYSDNNNLNKNIAFQNKDGVHRHVIDIFRDKNSPALKIFKDSKILSLIKLLGVHDRLIFTHSKLSFKIPGATTDWFPHQDNGYKLYDKVRDGFAAMILLEDMTIDNGCIELYPKSHLLGTLNHIRQVENKKTGDNQLKIINIPGTHKPKKMTGNKGDVIIFSNDTIHKSGSSKKFSKRLAIIAEVKRFNNELDDYGMTPIFAIGQVNFKEKVLLKFKSTFSILKFWRIIKKNSFLSFFIRSIIRMLYK